MLRQQAGQQREGLLFERFTSWLSDYMVDLVIGKRMLMVTKKWGLTGKGFIRAGIPASRLAMSFIVLMIVLVILVMMVLMVVEMVCCRRMRRGRCHTGLVVVRHQVMHQY